MNERPIIMQAESVHAILEGRKTQTRRVIKPRPGHRWNVNPDGSYCEGDHDRAVGCLYRGQLSCPYGQPGDRLWVKETWKRSPDGTVEYRADRDWLQRWTSPLFMPRRASRITLEVTDVRVERLQDITALDVIAEGVWPADWTCVDLNWQRKWIEVWNKINGKTYPWASNPWVWAVSFTRAQP